MIRQEQIKLLKEYKEYLLTIKQYQLKNKQQDYDTIEESNSYDKPKVLVLKRNYYGKGMNVT